MASGAGYFVPAGEERLQESEQAHPAARSGTREPALMVESTLMSASPAGCRTGEAESRVEVLFLQA